ncbi:MAG: mandelate racemase/muconate lactonizing enzyme family protein [Prosthecobacter sp.]|uniref:mandelate racemase/muconate lactonizing enzyme family protein n=1 Tax=Prosthecobacter sp. TaxID=1965333 RepID=UPI00390203EF
MRIRSLHAIPVRLPRDIASSRGTAGSPTLLAGSGGYRWSTAYPVLYSVDFETALVRIELENGLVGWGEAQAPLAPEVACSIVTHLLRPALEGEDFDGRPERITELWERMYATMRVRGQTGGFMLDAMSGIDIALWDLAGKMAGKPVCALLSDSPKSRIPAYLSGTTGSTPQERAAFAARYADEGISLVKLYYESDWSDLLAIADALPSTMSFAVDALWHLPPDKAVGMARDLDARNARWLECPLYPEEIEAHAALAAAIRTPIALGESYRTLHELQPFLGIAKILQPDLGRSGITGSLRIAKAFTGQIIPHLSIAMGPQIAAALHFAAAAENCALCEFNPHVLDTANTFLRAPLLRQGPDYHVPEAPGLGIEWNERFASISGLT